MNLSLEVWVQAVSNALALGLLYILMASGLALIFSIMNILQFAHGEIFMMGAYAAYYVTKIFGLNIFVSIIPSMLMMGLIGLFLERFVFRPVRGKLLNSMVISTGLSLVLSGVAVVGFGLYERSLPKIAIGSFHLGAVAIPKDRCVAVIFSFISFLFLFYFLKRTKYGQAIVASAQDHEAALLRGINPNLMSSIAMALGCSLAAIGGVLSGSIFMLDPFMGGTAITKGLIIIVIGGKGSLWGTVMGGLFLGLIDGVFSVVFNPTISALAPLILVIMVLLIKPQGLFGHALERLN